MVVLDCETTGISETDQVCEVSMLLRDERLLYAARTTLVRPTVPVTAAARGAHHIEDEELSRAPPMTELLAGGALRDLEEDAVLVGHNVAFDLRMLEQSGVPPASLASRRICTWRCAMHVWPEAEGHALQTLRYALGLRVPRALLGQQAHRAIADVLVTSELLGELLRRRGVEELLALSDTPVLQTTVRVGKYRGQPWSAMDVGYCEWVLRQRDPPFSDDVRHTARHWLERRRGRRG